MAQRLDVLTVKQNLITETCCNCGVLFAMAEEFYDECNRLKVKKTFYCPAGHPQHYTGKSMEEKLRLAKQREEEAWAAVERERKNAENIERSRRAVKGQLTKTKKRIANGVCPCCNRSFVNLKRHMEGQHPSYVNPAGEEEMG